MDLDNIFLDTDGLLFYHQRMHKIYTKMIGHQLPSVTGEGKIVLTDSTYGYLLDLVIDGKSVQNSTPLPYSTSPIENVGDSGKVSITCRTKVYRRATPVFVIGTKYNPDKRGFDTSSVSSYRVYYVKCRPNTTYTITKTIGTFCRFMSCENVPVSGGYVTNVYNDTTSNYGKITTGENDNYLAFEPLTDSEILSIGYDAVEGDITLTTETTLDIPLSEPLRSNGGTHDSIRLVDDEYCVYRRIKTHKYKGATTEGWAATSVAGQYKIAIPGGKDFVIPVCTHATGRRSATMDVGECYYSNGVFYINTNYGTLIFFCICTMSLLLFNVIHASIQF